ncbi:MAG: SAM-dependent methyltransferase [Deltaproteobacteria bacterium HGW-Deltaproteobacteria-14]|nr:MAG: SAM-dependent methyltransferase [Deltaproteobacteria bacterium HGW-Deltaproteobacteria-14]
MPSEAKKRLATTIRELRARLLAELDAALDSAYLLAIADPAAAGLDAARAARRGLLDQALDDAARLHPPKARAAARARARRDVVEEAAYTWLNRLVYLRLLEAAGLRAETVLTGGWGSRGYLAFRELAPALCTGDRTEGYATLLDLVFRDLALDLPGLFGDVGTLRLVPMPPQTLRAVVEALDQRELAPCWHDDTTLGWIYQYWNDPEREALDAKLNGGGKVEPWEIASKTQMFTERYMVEWLLQNSLGQTWLAMCEKNGWTAQVNAPDPTRDGRSTLTDLAQRRAAFRARREAGAVAPDALMPIAPGLEDRWKYWVEQPLPADAASHAPARLSELRLLDPACGSGHFLVIAFDLLLALYEEEAAHLGQAFDPEVAARHILEDNLHGVDLDPRAVQIAAAALLLAAWRVAPGLTVSRLGLVATHFRLGALPPDDPSRVALREALAAEAGLSGQVTDRLIETLAGVDHLGTLLRVDTAIDAVLRDSAPPRQGGFLDVLDGAAAAPARGPAPDADGLDPRARVLARLEAFLARHTGGADLGLRLHGDELAAGVRFLRVVREGRYHLVVANPPYQGTAKLADADYVKAHYPRGKADLFAAFLERGLELCRPGGLSAMVTMRNWMFIKQYEALRKWLIEDNDLRLLGDFDRGAFEDIPDEVVSVALSVVRRAGGDHTDSIATQPTPLDDTTRDGRRTARKRAAVLAGVGHHTFDTRRFRVIEGEPLVYWWTPEFLARYAATPKLGERWPTKFGQNLGNNGRFTRLRWEIVPSRCLDVRAGAAPIARIQQTAWCRYLMGAEGHVWFDPIDTICKWEHNAFEVKVNVEFRYGTISRKITNERYFFTPGIGFIQIGATFGARAHRWLCVVDGKGSSVYPPSIPYVLALMNASRSRGILESLNPGIDFTVGDVNRLPLFPIESADAIFARLDTAFSEHEAHREASVEFRAPGPSCWDYAQAWAQVAVDRAPGAPLPPWEPVWTAASPTDHVSYALGVALGRFAGDGSGVLTEAGPDALPHGLLYLSEGDPDGGGLGHPAAAPLLAAWERWGPEVAPGQSLSAYLRHGFFAVHNDKAMYDKRPIHWPLSSEKKRFVAWVNIHQLGPDTLRVLLADHLLPERARLAGRLEDLAAARAGGDRAQSRKADSEREETRLRFAELDQFIADVRQCAEQGPPPTTSKCPPREVDARYAPDLDDGVMVNSAALWPLLLPQWKDPKKWWTELATAKGRTDYDWSHLSACYFPDRVDRKCQADPSLAVAHGCFWRYHPARAYAWELRLQDELAPDFTLPEPDAPLHRAAFLSAHPDEAQAIADKEQKRRARKATQSPDEVDEADEETEADQLGLTLG